MRNEQYYDNLAVYATILQVLDLALLMGDVTNSEIYEALQEQNKKYMEKIIEQNDKMISLLEKPHECSCHCKTST